MPNLTTSADIDAFMAAANNAAARTSLGLTALATTTPGTGVATALGVNIGSAGAPVLFNGAGGTPTSLVGTNISGTAASLTAGTASAVAVGGITGLGSGVGTFLATPSSANLAAAVTGEVGSGALVFGTGPTFTAYTWTGIANLASTTADGMIFGGTSLLTTYNASGQTPRLQVHGTGSVGTAGLSLSRWANDTSSGGLWLTSSRGTTVGSYTVTQNGDALGVIFFGGADGTDFATGAYITANVDGTPGANDMPTRLVFATSADGSQTPTERLRISSAGAWGLAGATYGTSGDVLTSQGSGSPPIWQTPSGAANAVTAASAAASSGLFWVSAGADRSATATDTVSTANITTANVGSIVASGATIALLNTVATTVNAFGAATTVNIGASAATVLNFGGSTTAAEFRFLEPSGSGTNYTGFKAQAQSANITYTLPATVGGAGTFLTDAAGNGTLSWATPGGSGTVTVVGAGSLTSTAFVTGGGTTTLQTPSTTSTLDSSGNAVFVGSVTGTRFVPSGSTVPTNGLYLPAANTLGWAINSAAEMQLTSTALSPAADGGSSLGTTALGWQNLHCNTGFVWNIENGDWVATHTAGIVTVGTGDLRVTTAGTNSASVVTNAGTQSLTNKKLGSLTTNGLVTTSGGDGTLSVTAPGTGVLTQLGLAADGSDVDAIGFRGIPQNSKSAAYTTVMADAGKHIYHPSADTTARTFTIDSNANVAYEIGTTLTFVNDSSAGVVTISITSDTLVLAGAGTTGSRTLAANGIATAIKMTSTRWMINGTGLT